MLEFMLLLFVASLNAWIGNNIDGFYLEITKHEPNFTLNASWVHPELNHHNYDDVHIMWKVLNDTVYIPNPLNMTNVIQTKNMSSGKYHFVLYIIFHNKGLVKHYNFNITLKEECFQQYHDTIEWFKYDKDLNRSKLNDKGKSIVYMIVRLRVIKLYLTAFAFINTFYQVLIDFIRTFLVGIQYKTDMSNGLIEDIIHLNTDNVLLKGDLIDNETIHLWRSLSINTTHYDSFKTRLDLRNSNYTIQDYLNWNRIEYNPSFVSSVDITWDILNSILMLCTDLLL